MSASGIGQRLSIQERLYPSVPCFGCGPNNPKGLQLRSYPGDGVVTAAFMPWPEHDNGFGYLNGGIISTVLDCHSAAAVMIEAERQGWPRCQVQCFPTSPLAWKCGTCGQARCTTRLSFGQL